MNLDHGNLLVTAYISRTFVKDRASRNRIEKQVEAKDLNWNIRTDKTKTRELKRYKTKFL